MGDRGAVPQARERNRESVRRYKARNREQVRERDREQKRKRWQGIPPEVHHANRLRQRHGLTPADKQAMLGAQGGRCYLCGDKLPYDKAFIDHDHSCCPQGKSCPACRRGLACDSCNTLIGYARDDPARLRRIAANLEAVAPVVAARIAAMPQQLTLEAVTGE